MMRLTPPRIPSIRRPDELRRRMVTRGRRVADRARDIAPPAPSLPRRRRPNHKRRAAVTAVVVGTAVAATAAYLWWRHRDEQHADLEDVGPEGPPSFQPATPPSSTGGPPAPESDSGGGPASPDVGDDERDEPAAHVHDTVVAADGGTAEPEMPPTEEPTVTAPTANLAAAPASPSISELETAEASSAEPTTPEPESAIETARVHTNGSGRNAVSRQVDESAVAETTPTTTDEEAARDDVESAVEILARKDEPAAEAVDVPSAEPSVIDRPTSEFAAPDAAATEPEPSAWTSEVKPAERPVAEPVEEASTALEPAPTTDDEASLETSEPAVPSERPAPAWQPEPSSPGVTSTTPSVEPPAWVVPPTRAESVEDAVEAAEVAEPTRSELRPGPWRAPEQSTPAPVPEATESPSGLAQTDTTVTAAESEAVSDEAPAVDQPARTQAAPPRHGPASPAWVWTGKRRGELGRDEDEDDESRPSGLERPRPAGLASRDPGRGPRDAEERRGPGESSGPPTTRFTLPSNGPSLPGSSPRPPVGP